MQCSTGSRCTGTSSCCGSRAWSARDLAMISLRQHAISLAAVFLALAVGVVLGSGLLSNTMLSGLREETKSLPGQITGLNDEKNVLKEKLGSANSFDTQMSGRMVHDALNGKSVVVFRAP